MIWDELAAFFRASTSPRFAPSNYLVTGKLDLFKKVLVLTR